MKRHHLPPRPIKKREINRIDRRRETELWIHSKDDKLLDGQDRVFYQHVINHDDFSVKRGWFCIWTPTKIKMGHFDSDRKELNSFLREVVEVRKKVEEKIEGTG